MNKKELIKEMLIRYSITIGADVQIERIDNYLDILHDIDLESINYALKKCLIESSFFPTPHDIISKLTAPKLSNESLLETRANEIVAAIFFAIRPCGSHNSKRAKDHIGEIGWRVVEDFGGWELICTAETDKLSTTRAQLRGHAKSVLCALAENPNYLKEDRRKRLELFIPLKKIKPRTLGGLLGEI